MNTDKTPSSTMALAQATEALGLNLSCSRQFLRYRAATDRLNDDAHASAILQRLSELQTELRIRQTGGTLTTEDLTQLRSLQGDAQRNPVIAEHLEAQQEVIDALRNINREISSWLGVDFVSLARTPGCC
jgi:cell fate (sporulation/competence/biofilm development) regulator YlbF (YheA/YmcA/DUF963 family)